MSVESVITENLDVWTSAIKTKSASGRGSSNKLELYGIKKLRELIIELALRGKLIQQEPDTVPISELINEIQEEKSRLIKEKRIKKQKSLPQIANEEYPYSIPKSWAWVRLGDVTSYGLSLKVEANDVNENTWVLELEDVEKVTSKLIKKVRFSERKFKSSKSVFESGDVVYGKLRPYLDKVIVTDEPGVCTTEMIPLRGYKHILPSFLRLVMKSPQFILYANESTHGMNLPRMGTDKARLAVIPFCVPQEQSRIVNQVEKLMALCDQLESQTESNIEAHKILVETLLATLTNAKDADELNESWQRISEHFDTLFTTEDSIDQLKQTILQLAVMGKLVKQDPNDEPASTLLARMSKNNEQFFNSKKVLPKSDTKNEPFELPSGWSFCNIEQLLDHTRKGMITGPFGSALKKSEHKLSGIPVWGIETIKNGKFTGVNKIFVDSKKAEELSSFNATRGDLIISRSGTIDEVCVIPDETEDGLISTNLLRVTLLKELIDPEFFCFTFKGSEMVLNKIKDMCAGTTRLFLNQKILKALIFPIPPLNEQRRIISKVEDLFLACEELKTKIDKAKLIQKNLADSISSSLVN
ncbi:restriction endonuclease subunit S [Pseudoalteromonas piscicida]|uniref:Restriction endonuclease subunit S n=1 Tax=Pseudoalteromonas piscicida TaxID=43662 RepID=A0AAD0RHR1_PSEO7|nr:restriction endonuclease subunit S [Pseudoalteromonas piscicida]ASD67398.1 hypothetical protein B1L02_10500 [Pseudoalteromonas piscicida]AXR01899.1 restriction endonuclease subunit S [Pseudoalteromonas piscicida]